GWADGVLAAARPGGGAAPGAASGAAEVVRDTVDALLGVVL
ncbi:MAG: hypothetical protein JWL68_3515, partial [Actinomycetia bacterium]|nr:hypothetical protein [Actinomycetes bacterium]